MGKLEDLLLVRQVEQTTKAEEIINKIDDLVEKFPLKFKKSPHFESGRNCRMDNICVSVRSIADFDTWTRIYTIEVPGKNGDLVFCAEKMGLFEGDEYKINSLHNIGDGGLTKLIELEKKLQKNVE